VPQPVQICIGNIFGNVEDAFSIPNHLLQGKPQRAAMDFCRVAFNTVFGLGGCIDIASAMGISKETTDFADTLGVWKIGGGAYVVLPLLGPSTIRDAIGSQLQSTLDPVSRINPSRVMYAVIVARTINTRTKFLDIEKTVDSVALDRYKFIRDAYLQRRYYQINGDYPPDSFPDESTEASDTTTMVDSTTNTIDNKPGQETKPATK
jgi:phospholipid-binding lipoprotein MlaA